LKIDTEYLPVERTADDRGRVRLGPEWADKRLRVVVVEELDD